MATRKAASSRAIHPAQAQHEIHDLEAVITADVTRALEEDIGAGDRTAALVPAKAQALAHVITRQDCVLAGTAWFERCYSELDPDSEIFWHFKEGARVPAGAQLCEIEGNARALLTAERASLNFLQTLSGVATRTRIFADAVKGTKARVFDTRKTLPGLRRALKYAVTVGGGQNHRIGLYDGILIKENHIMAAGGVTPALQAAFKAAPEGVFVQIEVETLDQLREALAAGCKLILLDNFTSARMKQAVDIARTKGNRGTELEASGGITLKNVRRYAETGVQRISIGTLTKDIEAVDLSMRFHLK
ncbi:MAG: carboxylating nicotinate-nucleotide diphosphorylase [Betaproteobacteria bacterium]|nr:carboxylating nicotinate-nucleotide diphosphorylase [Betaproteobacteria bacterium]